MKILHTETLKGWGGQQGKVLKELLVTRKLGHTPLLLCNPNAEIGRRARKEGIETIEHPMNKKNYFVTVPFLLKLIREEKVDIVISHGSTDSWIVAMSGLFSPVRTVRERHNEFPIRGYLSRLLHRRLFDRLLVVSDNVRNYLLSIGVPEEKIVTMPSSVDVTRISRADSTFREEERIPTEAPIVGFFSSSLRREKGVFDFEEVIRIVSKAYPETFFVLAGAYSEKTRAEIERRLEDENISINRVIWTGFRNDISNILHAFDIAVYPSHSEGMPNALLEQMACSLPTVVYDIPPMNYLVKEGVTGFTAPFREPEKLAEGVIRLLRNEEERKRIGERAYQKVKNDHDISILDERFRNLFSELKHG